MPTCDVHNDYLFTKLMQQLRAAIEQHELESFVRQFIDYPEDSEIS